MRAFNPNMTDYYSYTGQHVHEIIGSTEFSGEHTEQHSHRFAAMSGDAIETRGSHFHNICFHTDSFGTHYHEYGGPSTLAIPTGNGRHVHFANGLTNSADGHTHEFQFVSMINNPTEPNL